MLVAQIDILETMTPLEFLSFRDRLEFGERLPVASVPGARVRARLEGPEGAGALPGGSEAARTAGAPARVAARSGTPSCTTSPPAACRCPQADLERDVTRRVEPSPALREVLVDVYRSHPALAELCERLVDLDEGIMEWRYRHVKMVQRTIGTRRGTGGSAGADYLLATLNQPLFPDLWAIRTEF